MRDLISRQAAIDALDVLCEEHRYRIPGKRETYSQYNEAWQDALDRAEGAIGNLPSAQPQLEECPIYGGMCGYPSNLCYECPRHEGAKERPQWWTEGLQPFAQPRHYHEENLLTYAHDMGVTLEQAKKELQKVTEQPEIIRCNSCKYWTQSTGEMKGYGLGRCDFHDADLVACNGFCYWAERRTDE